MLSKPEAKANLRENHRLLPTQWSVDARLMVISIIPAMVPTPKTSK